LDLRRKVPCSTTQWYTAWTLRLSPGLNVTAKKSLIPSKIQQFVLIDDVDGPLSVKSRDLPAKAALPTKTLGRPIP